MKSPWSSLTEYLVFLVQPQPPPLPPTIGPRTIRKNRLTGTICGQCEVKTAGLVNAHKHTKTTLYGWNSCIYNVCGFYRTKTHQPPVDIPFRKCTMRQTNLFWSIRCLSDLLFFHNFMSWAEIKSFKWVCKLIPGIQKTWPALIKLNLSLACFSLFILLVHHFPSVCAFLSPHLPSYFFLISHPSYLSPCNMCLSLFLSLLHTLQIVFIPSTSPFPPLYYIPTWFCISFFHPLYHVCLSFSFLSLPLPRRAPAVQSVGSICVFVFALITV